MNMRRIEFIRAQRVGAWKRRAIVASFTSIILVKLYFTSIALAVIRIFKVSGRVRRVSRVGDQTSRRSGK